MFLQSKNDHVVLLGSLGVLLLCLMQGVSSPSICQYECQGGQLVVASWDTAWCARTSKKLSAMHLPLNLQVVVVIGLLF